MQFDAPYFLLPSIGGCIPGESALNSGVGRGIERAAETPSVPGVAVGALTVLSFAEIASVLISAGDISAIAAGDEIDDNAGFDTVAVVVVAGVDVVVTAGLVVVTAVLECEEWLLCVFECDEWLP
mgnify:CR=1 FL=1